VGEIDDMLAALQDALGPLDGEPAPLEGGITNHNYRARLGNLEYVVRRHGSETALLGIDRTAERIASEAAAALGIAPEVAAVLEEGLATRYIRCAAMEPQDVRESAEEVARSLRAFHDSGTRLPVRFWVPDLLDRYAEVVLRRGGRLPAQYEDVLAAARRIASVLPGEEARPCHNDLLPGNLIRSDLDGRLLIVDWEYAGMGHPLFDLGNLSINNGFGEEDDERLLRAYDGTVPAPRRRAALKLMRVLSDAREGAWGVVQGAVSELDFDFAGYARSHFERMLAAVARADFEEWLASA
jgi:thiamine kinase-like enzyme